MEKYKLLNNSDISSLDPEGARSRRDTRGSTPSVASFREQSCALPDCWWVQGHFLRTSFEVLQKVTLR